jgi:hypothetical protein
MGTSELHPHFVVVEPYLPKTRLVSLTNLLCMFSKFLNSIKRNYTNIEREALTMVFPYTNSYITSWVIDLYFMLTKWPLST